MTPPQPPDRVETEPDVDNAARIAQVAERVRELYLQHPEEAVLEHADTLVTLSDVVQELAKLRADIACRQEEKEITLHIQDEYSTALRAMARRVGRTRQIVKDAEHGWDVSYRFAKDVCKQVREARARLAEVEAANVELARQLADELEAAKQGGIAFSHTLGAVIRERDEAREKLEQIRATAIAASGDDALVERCAEIAKFAWANFPAPEATTAWSILHEDHKANYRRVALAVLIEAGRLEAAVPSAPSVEPEPVGDVRVKHEYEVTYVGGCRIYTSSPDYVRVWREQSTGIDSIRHRTITVTTTPWVAVPPTPEDEDGEGR